MSATRKNDSEMSPFVAANMWTIQNCLSNYYVNLYLGTIAVKLRHFWFFCRIFSLLICYLNLTKLAVISKWWEIIRKTYRDLINASIYFSFFRPLISFTLIVFYFSSALISWCRQLLSSSSVRRANIIICSY